MTIGSSRPDRAAVPEIEVTPAMVEAGVSALHASGAVEHPLEADRLVVAEVFRQMALARSR